MLRNFDAILAIDIVIRSALDDAEDVSWLSAARRRIDALAERGHGVIVSADGLSLIYAFPDVGTSVDFALDVKNAVTAMAKPSGSTVRVRTGIARACAQEGEGLAAARALTSLLTDGICVSAGVLARLSAPCPLRFRDLGNDLNGLAHTRIHAQVASWPGSRGPDLACATPPRKRVATWLIGGHAATLITASVAALGFCTASALDAGGERLAAQARSMRATASVNTRAPSTMSSSAVSSVQ